MRKKILNWFRGRPAFLSGNECLNLRFYQYGIDTVIFFLDRTGGLDVRVRDLPHYDFVRRLHNGEKNPDSEYRMYLQSSWGSGDYGAKISRFKSHVELLRVSGPVRPPVLTTIPGVRGFLVVDGNHRTSIAGVLDFPIRVQYVSYRRMLADHSCLKRFFEGRDLRAVRKLLEFGVDPAWQGPFASLFKVLMAEGQAVNVLDLSNIPGLLEALYYRVDFASGMSVFREKMLANLSLRSIVLRGLYPCLNVTQEAAVEDHDFRRANLLICTRKSFTAFEKTIQDSLPLEAKIVLLVGSKGSLSRSYLELVSAHSIGMGRKAMIYKVVSSEVLL